MRLLIGFSILCVGVAVLGAENAPALDPQQPYSATRSRPVQYDVELQFIVTAPYQTKTLQVWVPIPPSDQGQVVISSELSTFPERVDPELGVEPQFGNRFAYFKFANPRGAQIIRHRLRVKTWELRWQLDSAKVRSVDQWPEGFAPYLRSESQAVVADARFAKLLDSIVPERRNPLQDFRTVLDWVEDHFTYDHHQASLRANSVHALEKQAGHCSDYHGFCAAMGRLMGQPTRVTYGINTFPKSSPSHCKLEAFLPPYGWVSFDVSETQKLTKSIRASADLSPSDKAEWIDAAHERLVRGFRDNTWFVQTRGTDYELAPRASQRVPVVRTIYAEADGRALPDPDPSRGEETKFAWMTAHRFESDHPVTYPFTDLSSLRDWRLAPRSEKTNQP